MNWFVYRLPGKTEILYGSSERLLHGFAEAGGFVVAPFDGNPDRIFTIPDDGITTEVALPIPPAASARSRIPGRSTTRDEHRQAVESAIGRIKSGQLDKCVIARVIRQDYMVDVYYTFHKLCEQLPDAFVFAFDTAKTGLWLGASPETLVAKSGAEFRSIALAGTRPAGSTGDWDAKNINEQAVVHRFIESTMTASGLLVETTPRYTRQAGPVEHLANDIIGRECSGQAVELREVARRLSPTPALSGLPRRDAIEFIKATEQFDRTYYGGYCGPIDAEGNGQLFVNLRSMQVEECSYALYAGGGIMAGSDPDAEWEETCRKAETLKRNIIYVP